MGIDCCGIVHLLDLIRPLMQDAIVEKAVISLHVVQNISSPTSMVTAVSGCDLIS